jgi:hypothetical protein
MSDAGGVPGGQQPPPPHGYAPPYGYAPPSGGPLPPPHPGDLRPRRRRRTVGPLIGTGLGVAVIVALLVIVAPWDAQRRQTIDDQIAVWTNPPTSQVEDLAETVDLTETGRRILFATQPSIEDATSFNKHCEVEGQTVLGCYYQGRIYVYAVTDQRLGGTVEVTTAHEMLHAAYERLSRDQRAEVDSVVQAYVDQLPADDPTLEVMASYPDDQLADEWHSRLGTEYADLPADLETHYAEYFTDRSAVLELDAASTAALDAVEAQIDALVAQIDALAADLDERGAKYEKRLDKLNDDIDDFNARADSGDFASQQQFDDERGELVDRSDDLEDDRLKLNDDTDLYNSLIEQLEGLDASYADLYSSLDSTQAPESVDG